MSDYQGGAAKPADIAQLVRFLGYLRGFGYRIDDDPGTRGAIDIRDAQDAYDVAAEYTGDTTFPNVDGVWEAGVAAGKRAAAVNAYEAGAREFCEHTSPPTVSRGIIGVVTCDGLIDSVEHWVPETDTFLCPRHWAEYQSKVG